MGIGAIKRSDKKWTWQLILIAEMDTYYKCLELKIEKINELLM
jgi:hypothetical protein